MIRLYKSIYALYLTLALVGVFFIAVFSCFFEQSHPDASPAINLLVFAIMLLWVFVNVFLFNRLARRMYKKVMAIINEQCDPARFIAEMVPLLHRITRRTNVLADLQITLSSGLIEDGRFNEALGLLRTITIKRGRAANTLRAVYLNNLCAAFLYAGDTENAQRALDDLIRLRNTSKMSKLLKAQINSLHFQKQLYLQMARGDFDGVQLVCSEYFKSAKTRRGKAHAQYRLAAVYEHNGKMDDAREAYRYVAENGNQLWVARQAREKLNSLPQTAENEALRESHAVQDS